MIEVLRELKCEFEWHSEDLLALDAADDWRAQAVADFLDEREQLGLATSGRTTGEFGQGPPDGSGSVVPRGDHSARGLDAGPQSRRYLGSR